MGQLYGAITAGLPRQNASNTALPGNQFKQQRWVENQREVVHARHKHHTCPAGANGCDVRMRGAAGQALYSSLRLIWRFKILYRWGVWLDPAFWQLIYLMPYYSQRSLSFSPRYTHYKSRTFYFCQCF